MSREKKRILILGSGVSGLSAAWQLSKKSDQIECIVLEKALEAGGWMGSEKTDDFLLEKGPRVFKTSRNSEFLQLIKELNFSDSLLPSVPSANSRYLWLDGKFHKMPSGPFSFLFSKICRPLLLSLFQERNITPCLEDETIWDFACRRFGKTVAERFFDPLMLGIYAGDIKKLSVDSCLPLLKKWEREKGGILKGAFSSLKNKKKKEPSLMKAPLFSFREGTGSLVQDLVAKVPFSFHFGKEIVSLKKENGIWKASSDSHTWEGDEVILALPAHAAASLLKEEAPKSSQILNSFFYEDVTSLQIGWKEDVLPLSAFGYLVPTIEKEPILGVLFDSKMFGKKHSLMTVMIRGTFHTEEELQNIANQVASHHLKIAPKPDLFSYKKMPQAIPQYLLGHKEKRESLLMTLREETQGLHLVGNYLEGVSVNDCIKQSKSLIEACF